MSRTFKGLPYHKGNVPPKDCVNLYASAWIEPNLDMVGCSGVKNAFGNYAKDGFLNVWNSEQFGYVAARRAFRNDTIPDTCIECSYTGGFFS